MSCALLPWIIVNSLVLSSWQPPHRYGKLLFSGLIRPVSICLPSHNMCSMPLMIWWPSSWLALVHHPFTGGPKTGHITLFHMWSNKWWIERNNNPFPPVPCSYTPVITVQQLVCFHCCQGTSLTYTWVLVVPQSVMSSLHHCNEFLLPWSST